MHLWRSQNTLIQYLSFNLFINMNRIKLANFFLFSLCEKKPTRETINMDCMQHDLDLCGNSNAFPMMYLFNTARWKQPGGWMRLVKIERFVSFLCITNTDRTAWTKTHAHCAPTYSRIQTTTTTMQYAKIICAKHAAFTRCISIDRMPCNATEKQQKTKLKTAT